MKACAKGDNDAAFSDYIMRFNEALPRGIALWIGGPTAGDHVERLEVPRILAVPTLETFAAMLDAES